MKTHYPKAGLAAITGGAAAALGATALLVRDVATTGLTVEIALMPVLVGLAVLSGHLLSDAVRRGRLLTASGLALLAILASGYTVYETMGRRAEFRDLKVAAASDTAAQRQHLTKMLREAEDALRTHRAKLSSECPSGQGRRCDGLTYTVSTWASAVTGYETQLAKLPPPVPVDPKAERIAAVVALLTGYKEPEIKRVVAIVEPFALPLILELASIILFSTGLSSVRRARDAKAVTSAEPVTPAASEGPSKPDDGPATKVEAERDLVTLLALGHPVPSQDWLKERWRLGSKGTVSKWLAEWEDAGIVTRHQLGKCKQINAA